MYQCSLGKACFVIGNKILLPGLFRLLLRDLLQLDGSRELTTEGQVGNRYVVQDETELFCSLGQLTVDSSRNLKMAIVVIRVISGQHQKWQKAFLCKPD